MKSAASLVVLVVVFAGPAPSQDSRQALRFQWPVPSKVRVIESVLKKGQRAEMSYTVHVVADDDHKHLRVQLRDFEFISVAGVDAKDPRMRKKLEPVMILTQTIPDLRIDKSGAFVGIVDFAATIDRVLDALEKMASDEIPTKEEKAQKKLVLARLRSTLQTPEFRKVMEQSAAEFWSVWVGTWLGDEKLPIGKDIVVDDDVPMPDGGSAAGKLTLRNHGPVASMPGHVRLTAKSLVEGEAARKALAGLIQKLAPSQPKGEEFAAGMLLSVRVTSQIEVVTKPSTLQPRTALLEKEVVLELKGKPPAKQIERREYTFRWQ